MKRNRDNQRQRVYDWEKVHIWPIDHPDYWNRYDEKPDLTLKQCQELVNFVWNDYITNKSNREDPPRVKPARGCYSWGSGTVIRLTPSCQFLHMVLHELTHCFQAIVPSMDNRIAWHGPEFVRLYIDLIVKYTSSANEEFLVSTAIERKIDVAGKDEVPRPRRKERSS